VNGDLSKQKHVYLLTLGALLLDWASLERRMNFHLLTMVHTQYLKRRLFEKMFKIRNMMLRHVVTAKPNMTVKKAIEMLFKRHVGAIVVTDDNRKCVGIFTERDAIRVVAQEIPLSVPLKKVMTKNVVTISEDATFEESRKLLISRRVRHLPVVNSEGRLAGLVVVRDFLDELFGIRS
jgi:CBS domain-containing protein